MQPTVKITGLPKVVSPALTAKVPLVNGTETDYALLSDLITLFFNNVPTGVIPGLANDYVISGGAWTGDSLAVNRNASMSAMVVYLGQRSISISAVTARTFTASKDTYIDILNNLDGTGTIVYTEVANNAASPPLAANSVRIGIIVTGATTIAAAGSINQGQESAVLPIASSIAYSVTESLGNLICPRDPNKRLLGYKQVLANQNTADGTGTIVITGLNCPVILTASRKIKVTGKIGAGANATSTNGVGFNLYDSTAAVQIAEDANNSARAAGEINLSPSVVVTPPAGGLRTYQGRFRVLAGGTASTNASTTIPGWIMIESE